jgi:hypothetical protein
LKAARLLKPNIEKIDNENSGPEKFAGEGPKKKKRIHVNNIQIPKAGAIL